MLHYRSLFVFWLAGFMLPIRAYAWPHGHELLNSVVLPPSKPIASVERALLTRAEYRKGGDRSNVRPESAAFSPDGTRLLTASDDWNAYMWDGRTGKPLVVLKGHTRSVRLAAFSPDGTRIVTASDDKTSRLWNGRTGKFIAEFKRKSGKL